MTHPAPRSPWRTPTVVAALVATVAHVPVTPEHLREAPYVGWAFIGFMVLTLALAVGLLRAESRARYQQLATLSVLAAVAYAATRVVAFPEIGDDVGNWLEPLGVLSVASELLTAAGCLAALRGGRRFAASPAS